MNAAAWLRALQLLLRLIGYINAEHAAAKGFTHHGEYFGLPIWMKGAEAPEIACKWPPLDWLIPVVVWIEGALRSMFFPEQEPCIQILQGAPIRPVPGAQQS